MTPEEARKTNNLKIIGLSVAGVTVLTAAGIFFCIKRAVQKVCQKNFRKLQNYFQKKLQNIKLNNAEKESSFTSRAYIYMIKVFDTAAKKEVKR